MPKAELVRKQIVTTKQNIQKNEQQENKKNSENLDYLTAFVYITL